MHRLAHWLSRRGLVWGLLCGLVVGSASAVEVDAAEARQIQALIEAQIAAFAADDAPKAFSYAAPAVRNTVGTPERFMEMVRTRYPVVYRPTSVKFLSTEQIDGEVYQAVQMTDGNGNLWLALYALERQADSSWRISGCILHKGQGQVV